MNLILCEYVSMSCQQNSKVNYVLTVCVWIHFQERVVLQVEVQTEVVTLRTDVRGGADLRARLSRRERLRVRIQVRGPNRSRRSTVTNPPTKQIGKCIVNVNYTLFLNYFSALNQILQVILKNSLTSCNPCTINWTIKTQGIVSLFHCLPYFWRG